jgi:hypothetical protein
MNSIIFFVALAATQAPPPNDDENLIQTVAEVEGQYLPLVTMALKRPEMRGQALDCYSVRVINRESVWRVSFLGHRAPLPPDTETEIYVGHMPQNARCPDISFEFDRKGKFTRKILSRE